MIAYTSNGWTKDISGLSAHRGMVTTVVGDDGLNYSVPNGSAALSNIYYKRYSKGASVTIPNRGRVVSTGLLLLNEYDCKYK